MTKIVNSLSGQMEMGSPMICMYLLGNPDHYKSHKFRPFFWQSYVQECRKPWIHTTDSDYTEVTAGVCDSNVVDRVALCKHNG